MYSEDSPSEIDTECTKWDEDCTIAPTTPTNRLCGFYLVPTCMLDPALDPPRKKSKHSVDIRNNLTTSNFITDFKCNWENNVGFVKDDLELIVDPFRVCVVKNFLHDNNIICKLLDEFNEIRWNKRSLDLYEFFQSADLKHISSQYIQVIYQFLKHDVKEWIQQLTGEELTSVSATCSAYGDTDYLLLHDDQQEDRLIAFVIYFMGPRNWEESSGGALQLFDKDEMGQPHLPVRNIYPTNNQLVFFQVTNDSYHQVMEVTNRDDCRLSINGWFHTKVPPIFQTPCYVPPSSGLFSNTLFKSRLIDIDLDSWITSDYLDIDTAIYIQKHIEDESEISLQNYFKPEAFQEVILNLESHETKWMQIGPPNRRWYEVIVEQDMPQVLERFLSLFQSRQMFELLKQYTDLDLTSIRYELQRWKHGCYSLLTDHNWSSKNELDLILYLGCPEQSTSAIVGGRTMYISLDEEIQHALITLDPEENNLNIVYRDTARITKYFSKRSTHTTFYLLICSYTE